MIARIITTAAASFTFAVAAQSAIAQTGDHQSDAPIRTQTEVRIGDLDLSTPQGQRELDRRVAKAARFVCRVPAPIGSRIAGVDAKCYSEAVKSAEPRMAALSARTRAHQ